ncbi:hypothetical protein [Salinivibrio kushneri]|uniref:hypothetical protein n=1 Tax=Salinivibrio kushneri TaxID=1908198 RepID=UPI0009889718|nr:hypothetical protein [Salinivibrio kushneri]OOE71707.1 hypothetical protein BZG19_01995 [Salinivibrio kushneri]
MGLDTRGFMDGALRAYSIADRHYQRKEDRKLQKEQLEQDREAREQRMSLRQAEEQRRQKKFEYNYGEDGQGGALREKQERDEEYHHARMQSLKTQNEANTYQLGQQKRTDFIQENKPLIQNGWKRWMETGEIDPIFDNEMIAGRAYDPRRVLDPEFNKSAELLEAKLPAALDGKADVNDPEIKSALNTIYSQNIKASIGQKDPRTGKVIKDARWGGVTLAADINSDMEGEQPGLVITTEVNYGDGEWVPKPVTEGRGTSDEQVKVIPLEQAMQDLTGQLAMRRQAMASPVYKSLFEPEDDETTQAYRKDLISLNKEEAKALADLEKNSAGLGSDGESKIESARARIKSTFDQQRARLKQTYGMEQEGQTGDASDTPRVPPAIQQWANSDPNKGQFLQALQQKGYKLEGYDPETIENAYQAQLRKAREAKRKAASAATAAELREANGSGGGVSSAQGAAALYQANVNR